MRDQANCTVLTDQRIQDLQNMVERARPIFGIEAAEPLVDEDRVELDLATRAFDDVRQAQRQSKRGDEALATGKGRGWPRLARMAIEDLCAEPPPSAPRALEIPFKTEFFFNRRWGIDEKGSRLERVQAEYELIPSVELAVEPQQVVLGLAEDNLLKAHS